MTRWNVFLLTLTLAAGLHGQNVAGLYSSMARELPNGVCHNDGCFWTLDHLLTYYGVALDADGLKGALRDARADVRSMAADELAKKGGKESIPWLADALSSESVPGTRLYLAKALAQLGDDRGVPAIERLCKSGGQSDPSAEARVRLQATEFLRDLHRNACNDCTIDLLRSLDRPGAPREFGLRTAALSMADVLESATGNEIALIRGIAERWISDEDESVRRMASLVLASYGDAGSYQKLKTAITVEQDATVRACMQTELRRMEGRLQGTSAK